MHKTLLIRILIISSILAGCSKSTPVPTDLPGEASSTPAITNTIEPTKTVTPAEVLQFSEYTIDLVLDYDSKQAQVNETIRFQNNTGGELTDLVLAVEPNLWADCFSLESISIDGEMITSYELDGQRLTIPQRMIPKQIVTIAISYELSIPRIEVNDQATIIRTQVFGYTTRQMNLVDWYPFVVPYNPGEGWLLSEPATYGEHLAYESADFEVTIHLSGESKPVIAASGSLISSDGEGSLYTLEKGRSFALSFSPDYLLKTQEIDGITVQSYYFAGADLGGQAALDATVQALKVYNQNFGPYQHSTLSIVQEETAFSMEYDGLYFLERPLYYGYSGADTDFLPTIAAHETAHQWWFGLVGTDQANQPWLDEALATYSERLFNESISLEKGKWWYLARLSLAESKDCPIDISIYGFYEFGCYYTESVYMRGGLFMQALRDLVGDQVFLPFLKDFATRFAHQRASTSDFFDVLREHTDMDLSAINLEYFKGTY
ncbi:MAG TPA: M1 family metallopeptidase [Anaerolineales bacterium]|nr:M1 family metallopeptidase [Anaerolineales bacterium]